MSRGELRHLLGSTVTVVTDRCDLHGTLLSCTTSSIWLVDDGESDVVVPMEDVRTVVLDAA
ncbi:MAG: hypothetical protein H0W25_04005 [Acidimicrobiia bacterium]|nr:hypothetical protein [Acidimicrobiia bacterium]